MIRNYTYLIFTDFVYIRIKGIIWCYNGLVNPNNIDKAAGDALSEIYSTIETDKPIVFDCKGVSGITDHSWDLLFQSISKMKRESHFLNMEIIAQKISASQSEFCSNLKMQHDDIRFSIFENECIIRSFDKINDEIATQISKNISKAVGKSFIEYPGGIMQLLASTPIFSNGEFDAAQLVSNQSSFYWISLRLADNIEKIIKEERIAGRIKILTVSLRASPLAAAAALLNGRQIETVDHFGPVFKNNETNISLADVEEYIYVGDFTVGGTEIKISKTYAHMKNARLHHAIVIGSLMQPDSYKEFKLHPIVLLKNCNSIVKYSLES